MAPTSRLTAICGNGGDVIAKVIDAAEAIEQPPEPADEFHRYRCDLENAGRVACPLCGSRGSGAFGTETAG